MLQRNGFKGGMNNDADASVIPTDFYLDAKNLTLTGDGKFFALENIKGSELLGSIVGSFAGGQVLGAFENKYTIGTETDVKCITVMTAKSGGNFIIWCYRLDTNVVKPLFSQTFTADFANAIPVIDGVVYPENGLDIIYFTDGYNELRKLRCEIPTGAADYFLTQTDLSLQRRATQATALYTPQTSGGSLLSGSYQFSFRVYNENTKTYSRWTIPSWPINISSSGEGYYGFSTSKKIDITFRLLDSEIPYWTHFQVAVIENTQATVQTIGSLQKLTDLTGGSVLVAGYTDYAFSYKSNDRIAEVALSDIVVDLAAIENVKTLAVKNNRLFAGNINYTNLSYDRTPTVTGDTIVQATSSATDDASTTAYRGYFRDETYRFYVVYWDEFYNLSRPKALDMTSVSNNIATVGTDYRFRKSISKLDSSNYYNNLGLSLTITNHPSWARGFAVFRAKRKKNKVFQSPFIPAIEISGIDVIGDYPNTVRSVDANNPPTGVIDTTIDSATPMNPAGTLMPKNFMHTVAQHIIKHSTDDNSLIGGQREIENGEVCYQTDNNYNGKARKYGFLFEPNATYGVGDPYKVQPSDKVYVADVAFTRYKSQLLSTNGYDTPENEGINYHITAYANQSTDYWRDYSTPSPTWPLSTSRSLNVTDYTTFENYGEGTSLGGSDINKFSNLVTPGMDLFVPPNTHKMGVVQYAGMRDIVLDSDSFKSGKIDTNFKKTASGTATASNTADNTPLTYFTAGTHGVTFLPDSSFVNAVAIVDIEKGLDDARYGDADTIHDVVFTGAQHVFSDSELTTVVSTGAVPITLSVFGGDCYVSLHHFKIADNAFAVVNDAKWRDVSSTALDHAKKWRRTFNNKYGAATSMPFAYRGVSQVLSVVLESEINGEMGAKLPYELSSKIPTIIGASDSSPVHIPFPYLYNSGHSKQSDQKALIPFSENDNITTNYKGRVLFSDQKVYNTDISGFDIFRVSNIVDLDEAYYGLTKLTLDGDNLVAIQERGVAIIPVDANLLSTTDQVNISIRSGTTDIPVYVSRMYGSQHTGAVVKSGDSVFFPDNRNKRVLRLRAGQLEPISDKGMVKTFKDEFASDITHLRGVYDPVRSQYMIYGQGATSFCYVWDDRLNLWVSNISLNQPPPYAQFVNTGDGLLFLTLNGVTLTVHKMYTGDYGQLFGVATTPQVSFIVNPEFELNKTFDNIIVYSTNKLATVDIEVSKETGAPGNEVFGMIFDYNRREGYYHVPVLRDDFGARLRGSFAKVTLYWPTDNEKLTLSQVVTAYRPSARLPR